MKSNEEKINILSQFEGWRKTSSVESNKEELIKLARKPRPNVKTTLGSALCRYTTASTTFDPTFNKLIRKLAPHWFVNSADINKKELIKLAKGKKRKPRVKTTLGSALCRYTNASTTFDPTFNKLIRKLAPHWFNTADNNKKEIIKLAKAGDLKPHHKTPLGRALVKYIYSSIGSAFDPIFNKLIRKLRPDWFIHTADRNKKELIKLAQAKEPRRPTAYVLRRSLCNYTNKPSLAFDPEFNKLIRKLAPQWFVNSADINKKELIKLAKEGKLRPSKKTKLGHCLTTYIFSGGAFDPEFNKLIRKLRPDWFSQKNNAKQIKAIKKELIKFAKAKEPRPKRLTALGRALCYCTCKSSKSFDSEFNKLIRQLRPDWFAAQITNYPNNN